MASLHSHSQFSVIDGQGTISEYLKLAQKDEQKAFALTDHGSLGGAIELYKEAHAIGINPIIGCELYVDVAELNESRYPNHLTVLAKNESGYRNLITANNLAHRQFYYRPRITLQQILDNNFAEDWIILSGCMSSPLYRRPLAEAVAIAKQLEAHSAGFFMEFMWHYSTDPTFGPKQDEYLNKMAALHKATGAPMVITNDCHYNYPEQEKIHQSLLKQSAEPSDLEFDGSGFHFMPHRNWYDEDGIERLGMQGLCNSLGIPNGWDNAVRIGEMCDIVIPEADRVNWYVPDITGGHPYETLDSLAKTRLANLTDNMPPKLREEYLERYELELSVLATSPAILNSYLVTHDLVSWANQRGIPAAARGSMAGSLISYLLGITKEDPVKYRLSFARAVNPARPTIPDFDLDVSSRYRPEIINYLKTRYDSNIPIAAYTHYGPRGALRKVLRMEGLIDFQTANSMAKELPDDWADGDFEYSTTQHRYIGNKPWVDNVPEKYRDFTAIYQGLYSTMSAHPCGILVGGSERPLEHEIPLSWVASSKQLVSSFDMYSLKKMGLFKLDVLGLRTLDQLRQMEEISGYTLPDDNYDDERVLKAFSADLLAEIFQMDGYACRNVVKNIGGIQSFEDIIAANTLARPGCAQFTQYYRGGFEGLLREYPPIGEVLGPTNGLILYQEQVMEIARVLADFDDAEQDDVKEAIKYFRHEVWSQTIEPKFRKRCEAKGFNATNILEAISKMASYTFNRAHAMTYAAIAYKMMWYKCYYPTAYYASVYDATDDKPRLIMESHFFGVRWQTADVNYSQFNTSVSEGKIVIGLGSIKGVGEKAYEAISEVRPFTDPEDFAKRVQAKRCNVRVRENLQKAFAMSSMGVQGTFSHFKEVMGFPYQILNHELMAHLNDMRDNNHIAGLITDVRSFKIRKDGANHGKEMAQIDLVNVNGRKKCVLFPDIWEKAKGKLYTGMTVRFEGDHQATGDFIVSHGAPVE